MTTESTPRRPLPDGDEQASIAIAGLVPILVGALLVPLRSHVGVADLALVLMAVVVLAALAGGRAAGAVAALTATLSFDFFLTRPYLTLRIASRDDIETALILLVVGTAVGQYAARFRAARQSGDRARQGVTGIHRVAELAVSGADPERVIDACRRELSALVELRECRFEPASPHDAPSHDRLPRLERDGTIARPRGPISVVRLGRGAGTEIPEGGLELTVLSEGRTTGRFVLVPEPGEGLDPERGRIAVALADQVGLALAGASSTSATSPQPI